MPTSTNRPKPKPGQAAAKQPTGKQDKDQTTNGATQPLAKKNGESIAATAKPTTGSTQPAAKTSGSLQPTDAKSNGSGESATKTTSGKLESATKATSEETQPTAKTSGNLPPTVKMGSGSVESGAKAGAATTKPAAKASGSLPPTAKPGTSGQVSAKTTKATGSFKATPKPEPKVKTPPPKQQTSKREQKRDEISRRIEERRQQREDEQRKRRLRRWGIIGGSVLAALLVISFIVYQIISGLNLPPYQKGTAIDGISCDTLEQSVAHYHAHLAIYVDGKPVSIPDDVGRQAPNCFYWLHTHQITGDDGVIHIESPSQTETFQLYQFFDIWGQQLSSTNLLGHTVDKSHPLTVYVFNPAQSDIDAHNQAANQAQQAQQNIPPFTVTPTSGLKPYTGDPRKIQLKSYELIVLEYGTPIVPPQPFSFIGGE